MASIGPTLRDARTRARIDLAEVEAQTKIRARYLRAMENEAWDVLPGPVYTKSFLRTYADHLGLDSRMLVEEFKRHCEQPADHEPYPIASLRRERERERRPRRNLAPPPWLAIAAVLGAVVVALFVIGEYALKSKNTPQAGIHAGVHHHAHHRPTTHTSAAAVHHFRKVTLQLVPTAPVYVCLVNGAGKRLIGGVTYSPGQTIPSETAREFLLTLGNANVQMKVNGKPVPVPQSVTAIGLRIRPRGTSPLPPTLDPTCA
ncbi:MAG: helix-turn-helix domain-containing protein [Solirubrobacterales bacterium]|nr:helix-turn-helix domain-containing protein [Solirubrobacterales bacterium]